MFVEIEKDSIDLVFWVENPEAHVAGLALRNGERGQNQWMHVKILADSREVLSAGMASEIF
jgi:hypothetical protein